MSIPEKYVIMDIETWTPEGKVNPDKDELRYVGFKAYNGNTIIYHASQVQEISRAIAHFKYIVGHNLKNYDIPVLMRYGFQFWGKIIIDTYDITQRRCKPMMYIDLNKGEKSLAKLCTRFGLDCMKGEYDYSKLQKEKFEGEELEELSEYLIGDLNASEALFLYYYNFFLGFKEFMSPKDKQRMSWLTCSPGSTAYKCICNMAGIEELYDESLGGTGVGYEGGYVSLPYCDFVEG